MKQLFLLIIIIMYCLPLYSQDSSMFSKEHHTNAGFRNSDSKFKDNGLKGLAKRMVWDRIINDSWLLLGDEYAD